MPLGVCSSCDRAYLFEGPPRKVACPRCQRELELRRIREMGDLPRMRLQLLSAAPSAPPVPAARRAGS